jgi:hypothetical protein
MTTHGSPASVFELLKIIGLLRIPHAVADARRRQFTTSCLRVPGFGFLASRRAPVRSRSHRARVGGANELHAQHYPWRRLGRTGASGHCKAARHPHQLAGNRFIRSRRSARRRRSCPACLASRFPPGAVPLSREHTVLNFSQASFELLRCTDQFAGLPMRPHAGYHRDFLE